MRSTIRQGRIQEPSACQNCSARNSMNLIHNRCLFADKQIVKLQETPESIPEGETPQTVTLCVYDSIVDAVRPGDKVVVTGIYRAHPIRQKSAQRSVKQVYKTYVDVIHFQRMELHHSGGNENGSE